MNYMEDFFTDKKYIISKGIGEHNAIFLYKEEVWNDFAKNLKLHLKENVKVRILARFFLGGATDAEIENKTIFISESLFDWLCEYKDVRVIEVQLYFGDRFGCPLVIEEKGGI